MLLVTGVLMSAGACVSVTSRTAAVTAPSSAGAGRFTECSLRALHVSLGTGGVAAGTDYRQLQFQNRGHGACTVRGYPSLNFTDGSGLQVGRSAVPIDLTGRPVTTVTVARGHFANAAVGVSDAYDYPTDICQPAATSYLRISLPGERSSVLLAYPATVCTAAGDVIATPFRPGRSPTPVG